MAIRTINGVQLYYEVKGSGSGTPLLLIAGLAADSHTWQPVIKELARHFLVITLDNRGTGRSGAADQISIKQMADDCFSVVRHMGFSSVHLLGHGMGGLVAQNCAVRPPASSISWCSSPRRRAILPVTTPCSPTGPRPWRLKSNLRCGSGTYVIGRSPDDFSTTKASVRAAVRSAIEYSQAQLKWSFRSQVNAFAAVDGRTKLSRITAGTLVICGKEDVLCPPDECAALAASISGAGLVTIDAAHSIHVENPHAFTESIISFLAAR
jgi:pimeloyl-ACP methyl ester carboxylesterase